MPLVHVDAYRLGSVADVDDLDLDASAGESVTVVEWGQGLVEQLADEHLEMRLDRRDDDVRTAVLVPHGPGWASGSATARASPRGTGASGPGRRVGAPSVGRRLWRTCSSCLDTATPTLVAGLGRWSPDGGVEVLAERAVPSGNRHAELLTPAIRGVLDDAGLAMADLDAVVTGLGPGPFTGLRVGIVTARDAGRRARAARGRRLLAGRRRLRGADGGHRRPSQGGLLGGLRRRRGARTERSGRRPARGARRARPVRRRPGVRRAARARRSTAADVTTAGLLRAAAPQLADPSSAAPAGAALPAPPDATPPTAIKAVTQA